jgi:4-hydroxy-tetrahydrodipicolinate synthase
MKSFKTVMTALITPFRDGEVDFSSLETLVRHQIKNGVQGFVVNGTTAESPTLTVHESELIFKAIRAMVGDNFPLIMGTGSNSTAHTIEASKRAEALGADGVLVVVPYYNKPPQRGLVQHFKAVANAVKIPVVLYNVPGRTITTMTPETIQELSRVQNIVGIKEASGDIAFAKDIVSKVGPEFIMLSGDDGTYVEFLNAGGHGVISVTSHIFPKEMIEWTKLMANGKTQEARDGIGKHAKLINHLFVEANPIPVKMALYQMGIIKSPELRLPMVTMAEDLAAKMKQEMIACGVLS